jgi:hypothetical protein
MYNSSGELLIGVRSCLHPLTGDGRSIEDQRELKAFDGADKEEVERVASHWEKSPYYHHLFETSPTAATFVVGGHALCYCGNTRGGKVHGSCWWTQWVEEAAPSPPRTRR